MEESAKKDQGVWVVIPASGIGSRMQSDVPKQYLKVRGKTILELTISRFAYLKGIAGILVMVGESDTYWEKIKESLATTYKSETMHFISAFGGYERSDTVQKGLLFLLSNKKLSPKQWVMVHDAARPCIRGEDIRKLLDSRENPFSEGAILATPVRDTLKQAHDNRKTILMTLPREDLWQAQTPQLFQLGALFDALNRARRENILITDEASAMENCNKRVQIIEGSSDNIKLTTPSDLRIIDHLLNNFEEIDGY